MKKSVLMMALMLIVSVLTVQAKKVPAVAEKLPVQLKEAIVGELEYPDFAVSNYIEGDVWLKLCMADSKVRVVEINASNPELGDYVKKTLSSIYIDNHGCKEGHAYYLKVKFDLLDK